MYDNTSSAASNSSLSFTDSCFNSGIGLIIGIVYVCIRLTTLFPCSIYVLYVGYQRWRQQGSFAALSHTDIITFHMVGFELLWVFGTGLYYCGIDYNAPELMSLGYKFHTSTCYAENFFHVLICLERYLAIVYPITYMKIRKTPGVTIRNISIACVSLFSCLWTLLSPSSYTVGAVLFILTPLGLSVIVISFCSFSILRVLNRPGPGARGQDKERFDQSKEKAYQTVVGIMLVQWLWFASIILDNAISGGNHVQVSVVCIVQWCSFWFNLPLGLVLPILYLHREGKLPCW